MANLITDVMAVKDAEMADLVYTYNTLTGKELKRFESRTVAERRVEMAILAAKDADGKTGVPKGAEPQVRSRAEIEAKAEQRHIAPPPSIDPDEPKFSEGSFAAQLDQLSKTKPPLTPRARKEKKAPSDAPKTSLFAVQAVDGGTSKPQAGSTRTSVLMAIKAKPNGLITVDALRKHLQIEPRGYLQKLIELKHLKALTEPQYNDLLAAIAAQHKEAA